MLKVNCLLFLLLLKPLCHADHLHPVYTPNHIKSPVKSNSEANELANVRSRVCDIERELQLLGIGASSNYDPSIESSNVVSYWKQREVLLKQLLAYVKTHPQQDFRALKSLNIRHSTSSMGAPNTLVGPTEFGHVQIFLPTSKAHMETFLKKFPDYPSFSAMLTENRNKQRDIANKFGISISRLDISIDQFNHWLDLIHHELTSFDVNNTSLAHIHLVPSYFSEIPNQFKSSSYQLNIRLDTSPYQLPHLFRSIPQYKEQELEEEIYRLLALSQFKPTQEALKSVLKEQQKNSPRLERMENQERIKSNFGSEDTTFKKHLAALDFLKTTQPIAKKLGANVLILNTYSSPEETDAIIEALKNFSEKGYQLKNSRTIIISDDRGKGKASQVSYLTGDCYPVTYVSSTTPIKTLESFFTKPSRWDSLF